MSNLRYYLLLLAVFAGIFLLTFVIAGPKGLGLLSGTSGAPTAPIDTGEVDRSAFTRTPADFEGPSEGLGAPTAASEEDDATKGPGTLRVFVRDDRGEAVHGAMASLHPADGGHYRDLSEGGFEFVRLTPGGYRLQIWSERHVPKNLLAVSVRADAVTTLEVELERGVIPAGSVHDEKNKRPIADATVTLGATRFRTGPDGTFKGGFALPESALQSITLEHEDYDTTTYDRTPGLDLANLRLPMTRGDANLSLRVLNESGRLLPSAYRVQVWREMGGSDRMLKRDRVMAPTEVLELRGLHAGAYMVFLSFPESELAARVHKVTLTYGERARVTLTLDAGADVEGRIVQRSGHIAHRELTLLDENVLPHGNVKSDAEGRFAFRAVPPGLYRLRTSHGGPKWDTVTFEVPASGVKRLVLDFDARHLDEQAAASPPR